MEMKIFLKLQTRFMQCEKQMISPQMETEEKNLKIEMKKIKQQTARTSNETHRRSQKRKATAKEKELLNEL